MRAETDRILINHESPSLPSHRIAEADAKMRPIASIVKRQDAEHRLPKTPIATSNQVFAGWLAWKHPMRYR